jgi:3-oxoacyl-[acyl-carrier-protein] synthase-1
MSRDLHIVALGARTPVGLTAESSAAAIRAGISRVREHPFMVDAVGDALRCSPDSILEPNVFGADRLAALAAHALREVVAKLTTNRPYAGVLPLFLALPECRPGFGPDDARRVQRLLQAESLPNIAGIAVQCLGEGHAGSLRALEFALKRVAEGRLDLCIVGGVDSYFHADTLDWLDAERRLLRADMRSGFPPGEGAAMLAVAPDSTRIGMGLPSLARVRMAASAYEERNATCADGMLGERLTEAVARQPGELFDDVYCDINGERDRTDDWGFTLLRLGAMFRDGTAYTINVTQCGDMGAAAAGVNCILAAEAWERAYARGPVSLVWGASWGGLRAAAVLDRAMR